MNAASGGRRPIASGATAEKWQFTRLDGAAPGSGFLRTTPVGRPGARQGIFRRTPEARHAGRMVSGSGEYGADHALRVVVRGVRSSAGDDRESTPATTSAAQLDRLRWTDVVIENCELSGAVLADVSLTRVEFRRCQMATLQLPAQRLRDVRFINCKLDEANFRTATGERVQFDETQLVAADFYEAKIRSARFFDCNLTSAEFSAPSCPLRCYRDRRSKHCREPPT